MALSVSEVFQFLEPQLYIAPVIGLLKKKIKED